jgi:ATP-grasp domain
LTVVTRARAQVAPRVALAVEDERTGAEVARVAEQRGIPVQRISVEAALDAPVGAIAYVPAVPPEPAQAAALARLCVVAAENRRPIVFCAAFEPVKGRAAEERAAAFAYLAAHGAIVVPEPDAWFETAVLVAGYGPPAGPRTCVVAPPGGWLALAATALGLGGKGEVAVAEGVEETSPRPADVALVDVSLDQPTPDRVARALVVPVVARAELAHDADRTVLVGLASSLAACAAAGRHSLRVAAGLGPAPLAEVARFRADKVRVAEALGAAAALLGDHDTKRLVSAYGVPCTRQAVAQSPSAAVRYAQQIDWPVEIKAWSADVAAEKPGAHNDFVIDGVENPPDVRRAFAAAATAAGLKVGVPVLVRQSVPAGREVAARFDKHPDLGWTVTLSGPGARGTACAPAPLRRLDAEDLAAALESSRTGDAPPDRAALAELLVRASFAAVANEAAIESLELTRIVVRARGEGALLVDGRTRLRRTRR